MMDSVWALLSPWRLLVWVSGVRTRLESVGSSALSGWQNHDCGLDCPGTMQSRGQRAQHNWLREKPRSLRKKDQEGGKGSGPRSAFEVSRAHSARGLAFA